MTTNNGSSEAVKYPCGCPSCKRIIDAYLDRKARRAADENDRYEAEKE